MTTRWADYAHTLTVIDTSMPGPDNPPASVGAGLLLDGIPIPHVLDFEVTAAMKAGTLVRVVLMANQITTRRINTDEATDRDLYELFIGGTKVLGCHPDEHPIRHFVMADDDAMSDRIRENAEYPPPNGAALTEATFFVAGVTIEGAK